MIYCHGCYPLRSSRAPLLSSFRFPVIVPFRLTQRRSVSHGPRNCGEGPQNTCICTSLSSAFSLFGFSSTVLHRGHPKLRSLASTTTVTHLLRKVSRSAPLPQFFSVFPIGELQANVDTVSPCSDARFPHVRPSVPLSTPRSGGSATSTS